MRSSPTRLICAFDEVDAPLDDYNVERSCDLLEAMRKRQHPVRHHHPQSVTMSRMDRLFGVTMAEKGVSQLVSVELAEAQEFVEGRTSRSRRRGNSAHAALAGKKFAGG